MRIIGLTGGIASGKSSVSNMFKEAGIPVICLDEAARKTADPGGAAIEAIRAAFGEDVLDDQGGLDREAMAGIVFKDAGKRRLLESIIHPIVARETDRMAADYARQGNNMVIVDVPLLYEVGWDRKCDLVIVVYASRETQSARLMKRDGLTQEQARLRLDAQMPIEDKRRLGNFVIDNSGSPDETRHQVLSLLEKLQETTESSGE
ncbi:MAG: dephospho-CoA kinase [Pseudomonadota bacterium]